MEATNALLTEVRFPAFDAAVNEVARATLIFAPDSTKTSATSPALPNPVTARADVARTSAYKVSIAGLPTAGISRAPPNGVR